MKKILFLLLLLFTIASYGQAVFDEGIQITGNANSATATKVNVQEANGKVNTQTIKTGFNKDIGLGGSDVVGATTLLNQYSTTPVDWTATAFNSGQVVFYGGKQWIAKTATVAGDMPAGSSKWEEITFEALANKTIIVDATPTDGSNNAVSSNAVFDGLALKSNIGHTHVASQITDLSKASVGLGNVDNTSDLSKPLSTATINALDTKAPISSVHNPVTLGTANGLSLSNQQLSLGLASSGVTGALSGTDWNTFNGKFNTPTGLTANYLPKWNGSGFVDSTTRDLGDGIFELITPKGTSPVHRFTQNAWRTWDIGVKPSPSFPSFYIRDASSSTDRFIIADGGRILINKTDDDLTNQLQVAGTISASPATTANQVVVKSQLDAVAARPYKVYTALLSQTGTNAPTATVLENTLGGTVTFERVGVGNYSAVSVGNLFTLDKTVIFYSSGEFVGTYNIHRTNTSRIALYNVNVSGVVADSLMQKLSIEIRVYL